MLTLLGPINFYKKYTFELGGWSILLLILFCFSSNVGLETKSGLRGFGPSIQTLDIFWVKADVSLIALPFWIGPAIVGKIGIESLQLSILYLLA